MGTMVLTLISSTIILHLHSVKNTAMPSWVETFFRPLAKVFCVQKSSSVSTFENPGNMVACSEEMKNTKENGINGKDDVKKILESNNSTTEISKWIRYASVLERMFLVIWFLLYLASMGLLVVMAIDFNQEWDSL